jgi:hypothetical protein
MTWFHRSSPRPATRQPGAGRGWVPVVEPGTVDDAPEISHAVRVYTGDAMLVGTVRGRGRLSDILNLRDEVRLTDVSIRRDGNILGNGECMPEAALDAFEIELAMTSRLPDAPWTRARRVHKVRYPVRIDAGRYAIEGDVHLFPGRSPGDVARCSGVLFIPVTSARVRRDGRVISDPKVDAIMLNRHLVQAIEQADIDATQDAGAALLRRRAMTPA